METKRKSTFMWEDMVTISLVKINQYRQHDTSNQLWCELQAIQSKRFQWRSNPATGKPIEMADPPLSFYNLGGTGSHAVLKVLGKTFVCPATQPYLQTYHRTKFNCYPNLCTFFQFKPTSQERYLDSLQLHLTDQIKLLLLKWGDLKKCSNTSLHLYWFILADG